MRNTIIARARARSPQVIAALFEYAKANIDGLFDLGFIVTELLINQKQILNEMVRRNIPMILNFMKVFGLIFGGVVGAIQMVVYCFTENTLVIPVFGLLVGLLSTRAPSRSLVFRPRKPTTYLGVFRWHGMFFLEYPRPVHGRVRARHCPRDLDAAGDHECADERQPRRPVVRNDQH